MSLRPGIAVLVCLALGSMLPSVCRAQASSAASLKVTDSGEAATFLVAQQPAAAQPPQPPAEPSPRPAQRSTRTSARDSYVRLARAPNMFGDTLRPSGTLTFLSKDGRQQVNSFDILLGGGASYNAAQNNKAVPMDRAYLMYNGFYNAVNFAPPGSLPPAKPSDLHLYTAGFEKTFLDGLWSIDVRMPFMDGLQFSSPDLSLDSGRIGNMSLFLKRLAFSDDVFALSAGMGMGLPTGSDFVMTSPGNTITIENEAVHLMPFLALTAMPNDDWFLQAFTQVDLAASGNSVTATAGPLGTFTEQNLLHIDATLGRWLSQSMGGRYLSGIAGIVELHYTTTLQDADRVSLVNAGLVGGIVNPANRLDLLHLTAGLHFQLGPLSNLRVGAVAPLRAAPDKVFDSELQVSFNRMF